MRPAVLAPRARRDALEATRWIAKDNPAAAKALREAIAKAARLLSDNPRIGAARPEIAGERLRFLFLTGFPYVVVYDCEPVPPLILRVLHGARDLPEVLRDL